MKMKMKAHGKINWALNILGMRPDGYHELDMLMQTIELCDELILEKAEEVSLSVNGDAQEANHNNLVVRAALALKDYTGERRGAAMSLTKRIPARAGLGGGSADCAAALVGLNRLWNLNLSMDALLEIGLRLGADVPFCLTGGLARVSGIGENIQPMEGGEPVVLLIALAGEGLSTGEVFQKWDQMCRPISWEIAPLAEALSRGEMEKADKLHFNALTAPASELLPEIKGLINAVREQGAETAFMTGSGSAVVGAFKDEITAQRAAEKIPNAIVTRTVSHFKW